MDKAAFMQCLAGQLTGLPGDEIRKQQDYYRELLADMMEDGIPEQEAVEKLGDPMEIGLQIRRDLDLPEQQPVPEKKTWSRPAIILAVVGAPIWISLALAVVSVAGSLYLSIWAVLLSLAVSAVALILGGGVMVLSGLIQVFGDPAFGLELLGVGLLSAGIGLVCVPLVWFLGRAIVQGTRRGFEICRNGIRNRKENG